MTATPTTDSPPARDGRSDPPIELHVHVTGQPIKPGDRLLITFPGTITASMADRITQTIRDKLGAEALLITGGNSVMILPPDWQPTEPGTGDQPNGLARTT